MFFRAVAPFKLRVATDLVIDIKPGQLVDIDHRQVMLDLLRTHKICEQNFTAHHGENYAPAIEQGWKRVKRIGIFIATTAHYSGGRIFLFQYALALAEMGAEVFVVTGLVPRWAHDYTASCPIKFVIMGQQRLPDDLDLIVTDGKSAEGIEALAYQAHHPGVPLVTFCFESPNWIAKYCGDELAGKLNIKPNIFKAARRVIAISREGAKWASEWLNEMKPIDILYPRVNVRALADAKTLGPAHDGRPYAVWIGRSSPYKGAQDAASAVWALKRPFDLVAFGSPPKIENTELHKLIRHNAASDVEKFRWLRYAHFAIASSRFEGFGLVPGEALASGTPCVAYDLPVYREVYKDKLIYVPWGNLSALKKKVAELAEKPRIKMPANGVAELGLDRIGPDIERLPYHAVKRRSVTAIMILYYGRAVGQALQAIYPHVDQIRIAYGPIELWKHVPPDGSLDIVRNFPDPDKKIEIEVRKVWKDKQKMREWCTADVHGSHLLVVDADEIYVGLDDWIKRGPDFGAPRWVHFWHDLQHYVVSIPEWGATRWGAPVAPFGSAANHYRWSLWRGSYRWRSHCMAVDAMNKSISDPDRSVESAKAFPGTVIYHLGHVMAPALMREKHAFYRRRDGDNVQRKARESVWHKWAGQLGDVGDGIIKPVQWKVPDIVQQAHDALHKEPICKSPKSEPMPTPEPESSAICTPAI
jgi:glycosyltransferase involved in cell wall biosynthesis